MISKNSFKIIRPDDWHVHLREDKLLKCVINSTTRVVGKCIVMPNLTKPITTSLLCKEYKDEIFRVVKNKFFKPLIPCYLIDDLDLNDFEFGLKYNIFVGAKLYPVNVTTNSKFGVNKIENIYPALEKLTKYNKPLLIHGEKIDKNIDIFDREKFFIDEELSKIIIKFPSLKIVLEHVSSKYGAEFVEKNNNLSGTITPHHMLLTKKDVFNGETNGHHYCMPIVKNEDDLITLRKYACSGNSKFFIGTDSAPHEIHHKENTDSLKAGIFSAPCSIELYTQIFEEEKSLHNLERFTSINGSNFYGLELNSDKIELLKEEWVVPEYTILENIKVKNFYSGKKLNWKVKNN